MSAHEDKATADAALAAATSPTKTLTEVKVRYDVASAKSQTDTVISASHGRTTRGGFP